MNPNQQMRWWLSTGAVTAGVGAALLAGTGAADADTGGTDTRRPETSERAEKPSPTSTDSTEKTSETTNQRENAKPESTNTSDGNVNAGPMKARVARVGTERSSGSPATAVKQSVPTPADLSRQTAVSEQDLDLRVVASSSSAVKAKAAPVRQRRGAVVAPPAIAEPAAVAKPVAVAKPAPVVQSAVAIAVAAPTVAPTVVVARPGKANLQVAPGVSVDADWYFPGSGTPAGMIYLQHGNLRGNENFKSLATALAKQTNSVVVAPTFQSSSVSYPQYYLNGEGTQSGVAALFNGNRAALTASAAAAGYSGALPKSYVLAGHSFGGQMVTVVGDYRKADPNLKGVLLLDAVNQNGEMAASLAKIPARVPVYQIAAEPAGFNLRDSGTKVLAKARPGRFIGVRISGGVHLDAEGSSTTFFAALAAGFPKARNSAALQVLAAGYINDMYRGLGPTSTGRTGVYPAAGQQVPVGQAKVVGLG